MPTEGYPKLEDIFKRYGKWLTNRPLIPPTPVLILSQMPTIHAPSHAKMRLPGLDYLHGLAAFGIMTYHYCSWIFGEQPAASFLGRLGIYGVAIFYIVSGQTLNEDVQRRDANIRLYHIRS